MPTATVPSNNAEKVFTADDLQAMTLPDGSTVYLLSPNALSGKNYALSTISPLMPLTSLTTTAASTNPTVSASSVFSPSHSPRATEFQLEMDFTDPLINHQPINLSISDANVTNTKTTQSNSIQPAAKITSNHSRSLLNVNRKSGGKSKSLKSKMDKVASPTPSSIDAQAIISAAADAAGLSADSPASSDVSAAEFIPYENFVSAKRSLVSPSPSKMTTMSPDDMFSASGVVSGNHLEHSFGDATASSPASEPPSFGDVFGLHSRGHLGSVTDALLSSHSSVGASSLLNPVVNPTDFFNRRDTDPVVGSPATTTSLVPAFSGSSASVSSSSALSIPASGSLSPHPQHLALSLNKQIETVDAGLEGIKDVLISNSNDLQIDPTELLNLFMPDGTFTTMPGSPLRFDDLAELPDSAKDALSLAFGPQKTLMGPPGADDENSNP